MAFGSMAPGGGMGGMGMGILQQALAAQRPGAGGAANPMAGGLIPMLANGGGPNGLIQRILKMGSPAAPVGSGAEPSEVWAGGQPGAGGMPPMGMLGGLLAKLGGGGMGGGMPDMGGGGW